MRYSVKLDDGWDDDGEEMTAGAKLASALQAPETEDPLVRHVMVEDHKQQLDVVQASYSEAAAYTLLLMQFDWHFPSVAADLLIADTRTLRNRVARATDKHKWQLSLFDGVERIDPGFHPTRSKGTKRAINVAKERLAKTGHGIVSRIGDWLRGVIA